MIHGCEHRWELLSQAGADLLSANVAVRTLNSPELSAAVNRLIEEILDMTEAPEARAEYGFMDRLAEAISEATRPI